MNLIQAQQICNLLNKNNGLSEPLSVSQILNTKRKYLTRSMGDVVACAAYRKRSWYQYEVLHVSVNENLRGWKFGQDLLSEIEVIARKDGIALLQATCKEKNQASLSLFRKQGYSVVNTFKSKYSGDRLCLLQKIL